MPPSPARYTPRVPAVDHPIIRAFGQDASFRESPFLRSWPALNCSNNLPRGGFPQGEIRRQLETYLPLDIAETLSMFMINDMPDSSRFVKARDDLIRRAGKAGKEHLRIVACGECAPHLLREGKADAAIRVEQLWDQLVIKYAVDSLCAYPLSSFHGEEDRHVFQSICAEHSAVYSR
jgi:MEDS: MEthanogen/methylotroph, DcmR Sensory domain